MDWLSMGSLMRSYPFQFIGVYFILYFGLNYLARWLGNGLTNPLYKGRISYLLHTGSILVFGFSFYLFYNVSQAYAYLMLFSFPMDLFAIVLAYRKLFGQEKDREALDS